MIGAVAKVLRDKNFPPMDERLKNIVASQVGFLLAGGFPLADIQHTAVELGLSWDEKRGHNRLAHLNARVRSEFWSDEFADHADFMTEKFVGTPVIGGRPHPNFHPYKSDGNGSCGECGGPIGVHVRPRSDKEAWA